MINVGKKFGSWTIISIDNSRNGIKYYKCKCLCGIEKSVRKSSIINGSSTKCRRCQNDIISSRPNIIGKKFNSWTVISKHKNEIRKEWFYLCICNCGNKKLMARNRLEKQESSRCKKCHNKTHGMSYTSTYKIWAGMLRRCNDEKNVAYKSYGGRGISVCERWYIFDNFLLDMGIRPEKLQIDRINNNGNYEPGNCRWVTAKENCLNKKRDIL